MSKLFGHTTSFIFFNFFGWSIVLAQPANDNCSAAVLLSAATPVAGTLWNATAGSGIPFGCAAGNPDDDGWYKFVATASGDATLTLTSIGTELSASGAMIQLYSGTCAGLTSVACANGVLSPLITSGLTNGNTYFVRVYSYATGALTGGSSGSAFTIAFTTSIPPPSNDECINAILIPTSASCLNSKGWLQGASTSSGAPDCAGNVKYDVWYNFIATKTDPTIAISSIGTNLSGSARLQILSGSCGSLSSLNCGNTSVTASGLTIGNTYYIRVYSNTASASTFTNNASFNICLTDPGSPSLIDSTGTLFNMDTVAKNLGYPWEITYGPDDSLWITEARGYRVLRISSTRTQSQIDAAPQQILKLPLGSNGNPGPTFNRSIGTWPQGGMEGLAIHPDLMTDPTKRWVYIAYVYAGTCPASPVSACIFRSKIVRCEFYFATDAGNPTNLPHKDTLVILDTVISGLSGSNDHNSGRLNIGPLKEGPGTPTYKLYYTIGDMGAGQFNNVTRTNNAQNKDTCEGKVLRLNTEPDGDASFGVTHDYNTWRQWIPNDNPFTHSVFTTLETPAYSYGHRNAQGLVWGNVNGTWRLYSSEHGDQAGDEVNIIQAGNNYGWPKVTGLADNNYTMYDDLTDGFTQNDILANLTVNDETTFSGNTSNFTRPMFDFFNWSPSQIQTLNTGNIFTWPTIAPSSIDFYSGNIPGWKNSLLVTSLKYGMFRLKLKSTGDFVDSTSSSLNTADTFPLLHGWRVRDIAINPVANSGQFWVITDSTGSTSGPTGGFSGGNQATQNGGRVLRLTYKTVITLPINFETFKGKLLPDKTIQLDWKAETDQNHYYFEVEKSTDNALFVPMGRVIGSPPYYFIDPSPNMGNNYYRIKEIEFGRIPACSKVINVVYNPSAYIITVYPNPMNELLNIKLASPKAGNIQIQITDMQGRIMYQQDRRVNRSIGEIQIDIRKWLPQLYSIKITDSDNNILTTQKILKL